MDLDIPDVHIVVMKQNTSILQEIVFRAILKTIDEHTARNVGNVYMQGKVGS